MIFVLDATNKALKFTVSAGTDVHFTSHWADATTSGLTEGQTQGTSNGSTAVDAVAAPAASTRRVVKLITFHNTSTTTSRTVTLVNDVGGTSRTIAVFTLAPLATWYSDTAATTAIADGDKGDITVSGSGATWTIDNGVVTTAKILDANVTFAKMVNITSGNILGRTGAGSGSVQEITPGTGVLTWLQTPTSANLAAAVSDETGSGALVFATSPTITGPTISSGDLTISSGNLNFTNTQTINWDSSKPLFQRLVFRSNAANTVSVPTMVPNGTGIASGWNYTDRDWASPGNAPTDFNQGQILYVQNESFRINSFPVNSPTVTLPLFFQTNNVTRIAVEQNGNIGFHGTSYGSGVLVLYIANASTVPTGNPSGGGILYATDGELWWRGSNGTATKIADK